MTPIRVCFLIPGMSDGGAQKQCIYLLNELARRDDVEPYLIHFYSGVHDHLLKAENIRIERLAVRSNYNPANILRLREVLTRIQPDILLSWLHACDTYAFFLRRLVPRVRWIMTERNSFYTPDPRFWLRRHLGRHADAIIANSPQGSEYWRKAAARGPRFVIPNIVPGSPTTKIARTRSAIHIGRLEPQKNVVTVARAFCIVAARRPDLSFSFIGEGSLRRELDTIVRNAGLSDRVTFLGFKSDVSSHILRAGAVVSMSHHEGLPNVLLESIALNTPIVASDIPEHRDLLGPEYVHYVERRNDPEACAIAIEKALHAEDSASFEFARSKIAGMRPEVIGDMYVNVFRNLRTGD
ncbi:glycosyltransferase [Bradyrhizobium sp. 193]|uniref:glycosyltransferase n=1 Tax=Bradyrhizobium sp. 193 TaxID=2782661 RepID=UPI001FFBCB97|nr:glycosyltransferase [Bradyrhizobium sp. 193]MCK1485644.1 glycosyltransferase [Bradyrhizobium sp. 193]